MTKRKLLKVAFNAILYCITYCICLFFINCSSSNSGGGEDNGETIEITPGPGMELFRKIPPNCMTFTFSLSVSNVVAFIEAVTMVRRSLA